MRWTDANSGLSSTFRFALASAALALFWAAGDAGAWGKNRIATPPGPQAAASSTQPGPQGKLVILDHVVAVINGDIILESDVQEEMRFAVLDVGRRSSARNTPQAALQRLIDRDLISQQMKAPQVQVTPPTEQQVKKRILNLRDVIPECAQYHCETAAGWDAFLKAHDLTEPEVEARWRERLLILSFIQSRFGAGVRIAPADIEEYYKKSFAPEFTKRNLQPPPLETVSNRIEEILLQQRVNSLLRDWLQSLKDEGGVIILGSGYADVGNPGSAENGGGGTP